MDKCFQMDVACNLAKHRDYMGGAERATDSIPLHAQDALQLPLEW